MFEFRDSVFMMQHSTCLI